MTKVLVAEDDQILLENLVTELEMRGYDVMSATDGQGAINLLHTCDRLPDIIVSDIAMPDVDGFKLLEYLRADPNWNGIPFLFLTAFNSPNSMRISQELGADDYIVKPFNPDDLVLAMENKLKRIAAFRKTAERDLDDARQALLHMMSHELRSPLTSIYGGSDILADSLSNTPDETVQAVARLVKRGADRLNRVTNKALALIQIDSGHLKAAFETSRHEYDIHEIIQTALMTVEGEAIADGFNIRFDTTFYPDPLYVQGIFEYLLAMVEEPLRNAIAFSPDRSSIEITTTKKDQNVIITIRDFGPGIPPHEIDQVWKRFTQLHRDDYEQQGVGLGLSIVRESARIHGGDCSITSQAGDGMMVILSLPIVITT